MMLCRLAAVAESRSFSEGDRACWMSVTTMHGVVRGEVTKLQSPDMLQETIILSHMLLGDALVA